MVSPPWLKKEKKTILSAWLFASSKRKSRGHIKLASSVGHYLNKKRNVENDSGRSNCGAASFLASLGGEPRDFVGDFFCHVFQGSGGKRKKECSGSWRALVRNHQPHQNIRRRFLFPGGGEREKKNQDKYLSCDQSHIKARKKALLRKSSWCVNAPLPNKKRKN